MTPPKKGRTVLIDVGQGGMGTVIVDGKDLSHLNRRVEVIAEVNQPVIVRLELVAVAVEMKAGDK
jgi:hypothetical protein